MIVTPSYPDRGFAKIGRTSSKLTQSALYFINDLPSVYEVETSNDEVWVRSKERRTGKSKDYLEILAEVDIDSNRDAKWIDKIDQFYDKRPDPFHPTIPFELMENISTKPDHQQLYFSSLALFAVEPAKRQHFLQDFYFPWFFSKYPEGKILALRQDSSYEQRITILRWGNLLTIYDDAEIEGLKKVEFNGIKSMADLHHAGMVNIEPYLFSLANMFFPYKCPIIKGPFGCIFVLFTNEQEIIEKGAYPRTREELHLLQGLMKGDSPDFSLPASAEQGWLGRYIPDRCYNASELVSFFKDVIPKLNRSLRLRLDITNYRNAKEEIDFIGAFERFYTLDRIMLEINSCQCATNGYHARSAVFSVADKFAELITISGVSKDETFHHFFKKQFMTNTLRPLIERLGQPFGDFFKTEAARVYNSLYDTLLSKEGLWMEHRRTATGVNIRAWNRGKKMFNEKTKTFDEFVGMTVRAVRNTHHGYISTDDDRRFATYFSLHTGKLPDIFTAIPQLIWLAVLESPETTILTNWISDTKLQSAEI